MSSSDGPAGRREVAVRCFAAEYDDASLEYSESDEERAPNYVVTPTGARVNRLFVVGVLTEVESVSDDVLRGRVVDPTGAFVVYAGQYQPDAKTALERAEPPAFVAVTGKARTFRPDDADRIYTSIRPESINAVDADTRDRWTVQAAEQTNDRVATFAAALAREERGEALTEALLDSGVDPGLASGIPRAIDHYGTTEAYLAAVRELALEAVGVVAGERDEVEPLEVAPGEGGSVETDLAGDVSIEAVTTATAGEPSVESAAEVETKAEAEAGPSGGSPAQAAGSRSDAEVTAESAEQDAGVETDEDELGDFDDFGEATEESEGSGTAAAAESDATGGTNATAETDATVETDATGETETDATTEATPDEIEVGETEASAAGAAGTEAGDTETSEAGADETEAGETGAGEATADDTASDEMYELGEDEREAVEEEYGTEFTTGSEVDGPGEADIETPEPETESGPDESGDEASGGEPEDATAEATETAVEGNESEDESEDGGEGEDAGGEGAAGPDEVDLVDAVVETMDELDDGDGADRGAVVETVVDEHGVDEASVEDAIQEALMGGRCYEPDDGLLKAI